MVDLWYSWVKYKISGIYCIIIILTIFITVYTVVYAHKTSSLPESTVAYEPNTAHLHVGLFQEVQIFFQSQRVERNCPTNMVFLCLDIFSKKNVLGSHG